MQQAITSPAAITLPEPLQHVYNLLGSDAVLIQLRDRDSEFSKFPAKTEWQKTKASWARNPKIWQQWAARGFGIGVLLGEPGNGICVVDVDDDAWVDRFIQAMPFLANTLRTRGNRGCSFWVRMVGPCPAKKIIFETVADAGNPGKHIGEVLTNKNQAVIHTRHPKKNAPYEVVKEAPLVQVSLSDIKYPDGAIAKVSSWKDRKDEKEEPVEGQKILQGLRDIVLEYFPDAKWTGPENTPTFVSCPWAHEHSAGKEDRIKIWLHNKGINLHCFHDSCNVADKLDATKEEISDKAWAFIQVVRGEALENAAIEEEALVVAPPAVAADVGMNGTVHAAEGSIAVDAVKPTQGGDSSVLVAPRFPVADATSASGLRIPGITVAQVSALPDSAPRDPMWWADKNSGIQFDGQHFWLKDERGVWVYHNTEGVSRILRRAGVYSKPINGLSWSAMDTALEFITTKHRVAGALSMCQRGPWVEFNGSTYLNTCTQFPIKPHPTAYGWGEKFMWIARLFDALDPVEQKDYFLYWVQRFYNSGLTLKPSMGQAIFLAGGFRCGKTVLNRKVIGRLLGGFSEPTSLLTKDKSFTKAVFASPLLALDDAVSSSDPKKRQAYTEVIKKLVANPSMSHEAKFCDEFEAEWNGRLIVTMNEDEDAIQGLPELGESTKDKFHLFRMNDSLRNLFPPSVDEPILEELPHFGAWLMEWKPPEHLPQDSRYGVAAYHEASLVEAAMQMSSTADFGEHFEDFLVEETKTKVLGMFKEGRWVGKSGFLKKALMNNEAYSAVCRSYTTAVFFKHLIKLSQRNWSKKFKISKRNSSDFPYEIVIL